jgi:hypothetical protein
MKNDFNQLAARAGMTPEDLCALTGNAAPRTAFIKGVIEDLEGAYTPEGIRRWFARPRAQLGGQSPAAALGTAWQPEQDMPRRVKALSAVLRA